VEEAPKTELFTAACALRKRTMQLVCYKYPGLREHVEDIVQDAVVRVCVAGGEPRSLSKLLESTALRLAIDLAEKQCRWNTVSLDNPELWAKNQPEELLANPELRPDIHTERQEQELHMKRLVAMRLQAMTEQQRAVVSLQLLGLSQAEIARYLALSINAVDSSLRAAARSIRAAVAVPPWRDR
jgi:RNA polymerase sigma factor (sigma-70 family)